MKNALVAVGLSALVAASGGAEDLPVEPIPNIMSLPAQYPASWLFVHDINFTSLLDGKVVLLDPVTDGRQYKGSIGAAQFASFIAPKTRPELYVAETFFSRGARGVRTDVLTIYDTASLAPIHEIVLPGDKRSHSVTQKASLQLSGDETFLFIFNFTPAASVTIVDLNQRTILNEIPIPGCSLIYPYADRSFATLCGNGGMTAFNLDEVAQIFSRTSTAPFNDIDGDPLFMKSVTLDGVTYFPSFKGAIQPVRFRSGEAHPGEKWSVEGSAAAGGNVRPAGWQIIAASQQTGQLYLLMNDGAKDGDHKNGGGEVWAVNPATQAVEARIPLKSWGLSLEVTGGETPLLAVAAANSNIDFYNLRTGQLVRSIGGGLAVSPFVMHAVQ